MSLLSVIIPCYNVEEYLPCTLDSLSHLKCDKEELVFEGTVVNDFTNNGTHPGYKRLSNATLISNDSTVHDWNKNLVAGEKTIGELLDGSDDLVGNLYKVEGKVIIMFQLTSQIRDLFLQMIQHTSIYIAVTLHKLHG